MMLTATIALIFFSASMSPVEGTVLEAMMRIESNHIPITSFLERFKHFIVHSHLVHNSNNKGRGNSTAVDEFIQSNDSFQANYDFTKSLLTVGTSYNLLLNGTCTKISDVKITIKFQIQKDADKKIELEDFYEKTLHKTIGERFNYEVSTATEEININNDVTILNKWLAPVVSVAEPVVVALVHIVVNGVLGHVLTSAFDQIYNGRLTS